MSCYFQILLGHTLTPAAVSTFFVISGYLYFAKVTNFNKEAYITKTRRRVKTLLIPYLLWNLAGVITLKVLGTLNGNSVGLDSLSDFFTQFWCCNVWNDNTVNILGQHTPLYAPNDWPLWYLRDLIVISIMTPIIYWAIIKLKHWYFIILIPLYVLNIWTTVPGIGLPSLIFFGMGVYLAINKRSISITVKTSFRMLIVSVSLVVTLLSAYLWLIHGVTTFNYSIYTFATVLLVPTMLTLGSIASEKGMVISKILVASTFFVYAFHDFTGVNPIMIVRKITSVFQVDSLLITYFVTPFLVYAISVLVYCFFNKYLPRVTHLITGR